MSTVTLSRMIMFQCMRRCYLETLSHEENIAVYGDSASKTGQAQTFELTGIFSGVVESTTGMVIGLKSLDDLLHKSTEHLENKNLFVDGGEFSTQPSTTENLAQSIFDRLTLNLSELSHVSLVKIRLKESDSFWVEISHE